MVSPNIYKEMIACCLEDIVESELLIEGDNFLHLNSALRVRLGDEVLALDGKGSFRKTEVQKIDKKSLILSKGAIEKKERLFNIDLLLSPPKRDALNDCLRMSCELGIRRIYLFETEFTQNKKLDSVRMNKILKSSLVQSNNLYLPEIVVINDLSELSPNYQLSTVFHLEEPTPGSASINFDPGAEYLITIGPEGGFSESDIALFQQNLCNMKTMCLRTPILRTPTALCAATSWLISRLYI